MRTSRFPFTSALRATVAILALLSVVGTRATAGTGVPGAARVEVRVVATGCGTVPCTNGDPAPDGNGTLYAYSGGGFGPSINEAGQVAFTADLVNTAGGFSVDDSGIFVASSTPGSLRQIVRAGLAAPNGNGNIAYGHHSGVPINDAGQVAALQLLNDTFGGISDNYAIFVGDGTPAGLVEIIRGGGGGSFVGSPLQLNNNGVVAYLDRRGETIFQGSDKGVVAIVQQEQAAPDDDGAFDTLYPPALNEAGQTAFRGTVRLTGQRTRYEGVFRHDETTIVRIAREGEPSPDGNGNFSTFSNPALNNAGDVAFLATLTGTSGSASDDQGVFIRRGEDLLTVVRRGEVAPDGNGRFLDLISTERGADNVAINDAGQVTFIAGLTGTAGGNAAQGLFRGDGTTLKQIVRLGDLAPDGVSRFKSLELPALNGMGQVAFPAELLKGVETDRAIFLYDDTLGLVQMFRWGDPFLGSQISDFGLVLAPSVTTNGMHRSGLNDRGEVASALYLDDNRTVVAIASLATEICVGDCQGTGMVNIGALITLVNIALGSAQASACPNGIPNGATVNIGLLIQAVNNALGGCPA